MEVKLHIHLNIVHNIFKTTQFHKHANMIKHNLKYSKQTISSLYVSISIHIFIYTSNSKPLSFVNMQIRLHIILNIINKPYQVYLYHHSHKWTKSLISTNLSKNHGSRITHPLKYSVEHIQNHTSNLLIHLVTNQYLLIIVIQFAYSTCERNEIIKQQSTTKQLSIECLQVLKSKN